MKELSLADLISLIELIKKDNENKIVFYSYLLPSAEKELEKRLAHLYTQVR